VDRLVARGGHLPGDALGLTHQVEPAGERRAELEQRQAEPVLHRLARDRDQVCPGHEGDEQLMDGGAGQVEPFRHLAGRQLGAVQKKFENVERADDRRYHTGHVDSPFAMPDRHLKRVTAPARTPDSGLVPTA
jgi:hypothetical protein